jgi:non-heme chloroperoxidase
VSTITSKDGTQIYFKDWGKGPVVTFSHGWPLNADAWDGQMLFVQHGFRVVAMTGGVTAGRARHPPTTT